jgi:hypothetical protein
MLRCARPISRQRTGRVRLRSSTFARLTSEIFLSSLWSGIFSKHLCLSVHRCAAVIALVFGVLAALPTIAAENAWQKEWEKTLEAAKREGQVTIYISGYEAVLPDFEKEYPEIKVAAVTGRGNQLGPRLLAERRAEKYLADVVSAGAKSHCKKGHRPAKARRIHCGSTSRRTMSLT